MNDDKPEKMPPVPPFVRFVASAVPMVFDDSLSYYEALCALWKYVQGMTDVINNNATLEEEYILKFNELKSFVDNYFDNLDVQEEINNKLDAMVEDGTLQEIITTYIQANVAWTFDTVADMKLSTNLIAGSYAQTLGFHSLNDGGGAIYKITDTGTADEMAVIAVDSLYATIVKPAQLSVKQVGAYGDATHDDTDAINEALTISSDVIVPDGIYMVDAENDHINLNDNNRLTLSNGATIKAITNDAERYVIINVEDADYVEISGGTIEGDRLTHTGATGEWGYGIQVIGTSDNVYIHDIQIKNTWGDGLGVTTTGSVKTERLHIDNARRNGISVICVDTFISNDDFIENTNGTDPQFGVDIEPDSDSEILNRVVFNNLKTKNNTGGGVSHHLVRTNSVPYFIEINDLYSDQDYRGIWINSDGDPTGKIRIHNPVIMNAKSYGIYVKQIDVKISTLIDKPIIDGYFMTATGVASGLMITTTANTTSGNLTVNNPIIINTGSSNGTINSIRFDATTGCTYKNINIFNPIALDKGIFFNSLSENVNIIDDYEINKNGTDGAYVVNGSNLPSYVHTSMTTQLRQFWISNATKFPIGYRIKFVNDGSYGIKLYFQDQYIYGITSEVGKIIQSADAGAYLEIMRLSSTAWTVISMSGTWTHN